ncbi:FG-GAP-like repeat-containing protein [Oceanicola sp. 22II-s10i]|uniref:FG-GAP-like repeat-containing protein n=1 Tax=Oceanicola sp. 22II-s10i TaxID=1317116 RepID=UPI0020CD7625|nr:FG-GAP-like repeat-containing protein [Oceanicola sp. 22II-s10i]
MNSLILKPYEKRFFLALIIVAVLAYMFWTGSRYPALNEKLLMSGAIQLEDGLSFEAKYPITPDMGTWEHIYYSTLNWIFTNKKGMTFGVLFAAAFLTAAAYLRQKSFRGSFSNSFLGLAIGTPLGVCVNCAAPIAKGMYSAGMRAETTLSAMIASPTLNVIVLTMLFSLMPFYMAVTKIALSLLVILVAVPLICRFLPVTQIKGPDIKPMPWSAAELAADPPQSESIFAAVLGVAVTYARNLGYIILLTVPLMLLAGFLGAVVTVLLPQDLVTGLAFGMGALVLICLVGVFLPCPISYDVVFAGVMLSAGLAHGYVMGLLFTLGSFSVYSFFIVAQAIGQRAAWMLGGTIAVLGMLAGFGAQTYQDWQTERALRMLQESRLEAPAEPGLLSDLAGLFVTRAAASDMPQGRVTSADADRIAVTATPFAPASPAADTGFTRIEAAAAGIDKPLEFSFRDMWPPFWEGRSVATGDIDGDGDPDLVIASTEAGLYLYDNDGTGQFARIDAPLGPLAGMPVFNAALADIDNDGFPDLVIATYMQGNWLWRNVDGAFGAEPPRPIANREDAVLSIALTLADADRDGYLDLALGNWAAGWYRRIPGEESRNRVIWNDDGRLSGERFTELPGIPGETLSILFTDFDGDGTGDLIVGNDFEIPDYFYRGDGAGGFSMITHGEALIPHVTNTTMAVKTADLMNDGTPEIYLAQIAGRSSGVSKKLKMQPLRRYCDGIADAAAKATCEQNMEIKTWYKSGNNFDPTYASRCQQLEGRYQAECKAMLIKDLAIQKRDPSICALIPDSQPVPRAYCEVHFRPARAFTEAEAAAGIEQVQRSNVLLDWNGDAWDDKAVARGLDVGGWSWDTKIADFDNDGLQDVYIVNGTWVPNEVSPSNLFFHNRGDGTFDEASGPFGLEDYLMTAAATAFDMDGDGDLDMVTHPVNGPVVLFRNNTQAPALMVRLEDHAGNRDGIGALIALTDDTGRTQTREIQLGGGFMSFDAPVAHFGMGDAGAATELRVRWADGAETVVEGPLAPGMSYTMRRK